MLFPGGDEVSVPINVAYNHHFESNMVGKSAAFKKVQLSGPDDPIAQEHRKNMGHGMPSEDEAWIVEEVAPSSNPGVPTSQAECRKIPFSSPNLCLKIHLHSTVHNSDTQ